MNELATIDRAFSLIRIATGEQYGDGMTVSDLCFGYAEPGYRSWKNDDQVIVFGNWNDKRYPRDGDAPLTKAETMPSRLARALERAGCEIEWSDEWTTCGDCHRAMRTQADSYSWKMYGAFIEDACEYLCADCLLTDLENYVMPCINNPNNALTFVKAADLEGIGFVKWEPSDPHTYESGWFEDMNDDPKQILPAILATLPTAQVVFMIDEASQFYIRFSAYVREIDNEQEDDEA